MAPALTKVCRETRLSHQTLSSIQRTLSTSTRAASPTSHFHRSDFTNQPFTGTYEPGQRMTGPLGDVSIFGAPRLTPKALKQHLDLFVIGQERAKRVLSVAVYNHYQRVQELQRRDDEEERYLQQQARRDMANRRPTEASDSFPEQASTIFEGSPKLDDDPPRTESPPIVDLAPLMIEKSNVLMLGPSGVGKTLMAKTLARTLEVPFSMSDCNTFTQAGYIGEDAEICVQRLLAASNYDVASTERGIICLDEIDKIATARVSHGKDVSGEGVQQALLKIIEGTTLQINAKQERSTGRPLSGSPLGGGFGNTPSGPGGGKTETYNVRTDNILFIFTGAFIGLHKIILERISKGSIGFNQPVRGSSSSSQALNNHDTMLSQSENHLFKAYLPFFTPTPDTSDPSSPGIISPRNNTLDLLEPADLQRYGLIPELVGRIPVSTALSPLDEESLVRVLTEPRNSLLRQYEQLFQLSSVELRCTSAALREMARTALKMGTGARGLRTVLERLLGDAMFEAPGSSVRYVLITEAVAKRECAPFYFARGQQSGFHGMIAKDEEEWEEKRRRDRGEPSETEEVTSFSQYREKAMMPGST